MFDGQMSVLLLSMLISPLPAGVVGYKFISFYRDLSALWLGIAVITVSLWVFSQGLIFFITDPEIQFFILQVARTLGIICAICVLFFTIEYSTGHAISTPVGLVFIIPALLLQIVLFGSPESFMLVEIAGNDVEYTFQTFGYIHIGLVVLLYAFSISLLMREVIVSSGQLQKQSTTLLVGLLGGISLSFLPLVGVELSYLNPMALGSLLSVGVFSFGLYRYDLFTTNPISLDMAFRSSYDSLIVINRKGEIIKSNEEFLSTFSLDESVLGQDATEVLPAEIVSFVDSDDSSASLYIEDQDAHYHISETSIEYGRGMSGQILTVQDVSDIKKTEQNLSLLKQILSRVLRHNLRNRLTVIAGIANQLRSDTSNTLSTEKLEQIEDASDTLVRLSEKAQILSNVIDTQEEFTTISVQMFVNSAISETSEYLEDDSVKITSSVEKPETSLVVHPHATKILTNAIENAVEHNSQQKKNVSIIGSYDTESEQYYIEIEDNGPGLPEDEISVIESGVETDLAHGSGIGLWIMKLLTQKSDGEIDIIQSPTGTSIQIQFNVANIED